MLFTGKKANVPFWFSTRLGLAAIGFIGFLHIYAQRVGMSVAIVCMVNQTAIKQLSEVNTSSTFKLSELGENGLCSDRFF